MANLPYIDNEKMKDLPLSVQNEPHIALDGGKFGLDIIKKAIKDSRNHLNINGTLILEADPWQIEEIQDFAKLSLEKSTHIIKDYSGNNRILVIR